jgi:hypothetical protein
MAQDTITDDERRRRAHNGALDRAFVQSQLGNVPTLTGTEILRDSLRETYRVLSRTVDGQAYMVDLMVDRLGIVTTTCDCPAACAGKTCWHRGAARLAHRDAIALVNEVGYRLRPKLTPTTAAELSGKRVAS